MSHGRSLIQESVARRGEMLRLLPRYDRVAASNSVQRFPESPNARDSLGEALAQSGDLAGAIRSYGQALELVGGESEKARIQDILVELKSRQ